jgi:hypothetical protein
MLEEMKVTEDERSDDDPDANPATHRIQAAIACGVFMCDQC